MLSSFINSKVLKLVIIPFLFGLMLPLVQESSQIDKETLAKEILSNCSVVNRPQNLTLELCYSKEFHEVAYEVGDESAFAVLSELQKLDPTAQGCHLIAHGLGEGVYKRRPGDWKNLARNISPVCSYGAIHGVIEGFVNDLPDRKLTKEILPTICGKTPRADCNHILGHLILAESGGDVDKGLEMCQAIEDQAQKLHCTTGVFMENITSLNLISHGLADNSWLDWRKRLPELEKTCRNYNGDEAIACWKEIVHAALVKFNYDAEATLNFCSRAHVIEGARACRRHGIGIWASTKLFGILSESNVSTLEELKPTCKLPQPEDPLFENDCYKNIPSYLLATIPERAGEVIDFCNSLNQEFKEGCFFQVAAHLKGNVSRGELDRICRPAPEEFRASCRGDNYYGDSPRRIID